ncbi:hypothetical protein EV182_004408, partial [Spiromyces aspiralis]
MADSNNNSNTDLGSYTDDDPDFLNTRLEFIIPPPSLHTVPRPERPRGPQQGSHYQQQQQQQNHLQTHTYNVCPVDIYGRSYKTLTRKSSTEEASVKIFSADIRPVSGLDVTKTHERLSDLQVVRSISDIKAMMRTKSDKEVVQARSKANPYENVCLGLFRNRSSVELACIDYLFNVTGARSMGKREKDGGTFAFVDAAVGSEASGRLKFAEEWMGDGNLGDFTNVKDIEAFSNHVLEERPGGVDLIVASGVPVPPIDRTRRLEFEKLASPELRMYYQCLCQVLLAAKTLRTGGDLVLRLPNTTTVLSAQIVYILHQIFGVLAVVKPLASNPVNSERYVVCHKFVEQRMQPGGGSDRLDVFARAALKRMEEANPSPPTGGFVDWETMCDDKDFMDYMRETNIRYDRQQLAALDTVSKYLSHPFRCRVSGRLQYLVYSLLRGPRERRRRHNIINSHPTTKSTSSKVAESSGNGEETFSFIDR